jgi:hypothetical protein
MRALPILGVLALLSASAHAQVERSYGFAAGPATTLVPGDDLGVALGLSAVATNSAGETSLLRFRGEIQGLLSRTMKAAYPTLVGDLGLRVGGRLELYLTGGVQMFGFASRSEFTAFTSFGLTGGIGISARLSRRWRLVARTVLTWIPADAAAKMSAPEGIEKPTFLTLSTLVGLDYWIGHSPEDSAFE